VLTTSSQTTPPGQTREVPFATAELELGGMHCSACAARIEHALGRVPGVASASVNLATARAFVSYNGSAISAGELCQTVADVGYSAKAVDAAAGSARRQQRPDGTWTGTFLVPRSYLARNAELAYAGNVHVAQGRTVDTTHLLVTGTLSRQALYVGMTRGREANTAHVVTGKTAPPGHEPYQQAAPESVLVGVMQRDAEDLSATEQIR
jgi:copper chaperone CopZ